MSLSKMKYGCKVIMNLEAAANKVMKTVLIWGTPDKDPNEDIFTYLKGLDPSTSDANYVLKDKNSPPTFDRIQKEKVINDRSCDTFDITLLLICIKLCCMNMACLNDEAWITDGDKLENLLYQIKKARNNAMHEPLEITKTEFQKKTKKLREDLIATLTTAKERFGKSDTELRKEIEKIEVVMNRITDEPLELNDFLTDYHSVLQEHIISRAADQLKKHCTYSMLVTPLSFLTHIKVLLPINKIYTRSKVMQGRLEGKEENVDHLDLIKLVQGKSTKPQVLVVEGLAGSGKTTLVAHMTAEWLESSHDSIRGLNEYKMMFKVQCRDAHLSSFADLIDFLFQPSTAEYKELLSKLVKESSLLVIIDGIDEVNKSSRKLIKDILDQMQGNKDCTVMFTTRPEALQEGLHLIPSTYYRVEVELVGIPMEHREDFLRRYLKELHKVCPDTTPTPPTTHDINQCIKELDVERKEYFRLPLNLSIVAILMYFSPDKMNQNTTQTELYYYLHELTLEKLDKRLEDNDLTKHFDRNTRLDKVENWLSAMYREMFVTLTHDQLTLQEKSVNQLRSICDTLRLPPNEMIATFMRTRTVKTIRGFDLDCYSVPHKGFQERYGALYVMQGIKKLEKPEESGNVHKIMVSTPGVGPIQLSKMQNLLQMLVGMISHDWNSIMVQDVVGLLQQAGVSNRDQWLDVIEDTKCTNNVLKVIADHFPIPHASVNRWDDEAFPIQIEDGRIETYRKLLLHLPPTRVALSIDGDPASLECLLGSLERHVCIKFMLWQNYYHPPAYIQPDVDELMRKVWSRDLGVYAGQLSEYVVSRLQQVHFLTHIFLRITSSHQATLLMALIPSTSFRYMKILCVVVTSEVLPAAITRKLPDNSNTKVRLHLLEVTEDRVSWACEMVANLIKPSRGRYIIGFPRSTLDEAGWIRMIQGLGRKGVKNITQMVVPLTSMSSDQEDQISPICRSTLGASLVRFEFDSL
ncbi:hypothetical protein Pcinc_035073 [Petrolisthes cinctipes]|uniref:NACHT domain-containing protein n=1 Tax=Petrolisthes cinctipes TaxID=88211 RepID=A0AAE1EPY0_PETCI|nr:hypothetical protein Pcinc_035073 [Petrolisthes cinctipes]